jgi:hypothetical protein
LQNKRIDPHSFGKRRGTIFEKATMADNKQCSRCKTKPAGAKDAYCTECRSEYNRERRENQDWRMERRGLLRGIEAMRQHIASHFRLWNNRPFMGAEAAALVESLPGPAVADEDANLKPEESGATA